MARLFEQSTETTPGNLSDRLGYGRAGVPTKNITWTNLLAWLNSVLSFMKPSNNLSDVDDLATARTNLDVYDTTTIDDALDLKADKSNVLEKDNTTTFTPTQDYHPATKIFVENSIESKIGNLVYSARISWQNTTISVTTHVNKTFIGTIQEVAAEKLGINLISSNANWETDLEIQATSNPDSNVSVNRNPHFFYESPNYISMHLIDSSGAPQDNGSVWIRIYDWS